MCVFVLDFLNMLKDLLPHSNIVSKRTKSEKKSFAKATTTVSANGISNKSIKVLSNGVCLSNRVNGLNNGSSKDTSNTQRELLNLPKYVGKTFR